MLEIAEEFPAKENPTCLTVRVRAEEFSAKENPTCLTVLVRAEEFSAKRTYLPNLARESRGVSRKKKKHACLTVLVIAEEFSAKRKTHLPNYASKSKRVFS